MKVDRNVKEKQNQWDCTPASPIIDSNAVKLT